jgi:hypothetical protein
MGTFKEDLGEAISEMFDETDKFSKEHPIMLATTSIAQRTVILVEGTLN